MGTSGTVRAAAIYARISSDSEGTGLGVARQVADCRALAERLGWDVAEVYKDNDLSAFSGKRRPAYERMLADLADGTRDGVIVYHVDRLTRRPIELEQFIAAVDAAKVRHVRFVVGDSDIMTGDGLMVLRILAAMAANESATKSRRVKRKLEANAELGLPHGGKARPFGYENDRVTVRPDEAQIIRKLAARYLAGEALLSLARWLTETGVPTTTGGTWRHTAVRHILASGRIAGLRESHGQVIAPAAWPAIITGEDHARIRTLIASRAGTGRRAPRRYLLSGMLTCGRCGTRLYTGMRDTRRRYLCESGAGRGGCGRMSIVAEPLEALITDLIVIRLDTSELADALAGRVAADARTAAVAEALSADRARLSELADAFGQGAFTLPEWLTARRPIETRITDAERRLARATSADTLTGLVGNGHQLRDRWPDLPLTRQAAIISTILDHARIEPGTPGIRHLDPARVTPFWRL